MDFYVFPDFVDLLGVVYGLLVEDAHCLARFLRLPLLLEVLLLVDLGQAQLALLLKRMQVANKSLNKILL